MKNKTVILMGCTRVKVREQRGRRISPVEDVTALFPGPWRDWRTVMRVKLPRGQGSAVGFPGDTLTSAGRQEYMQRPHVLDEDLTDPIVSGIVLLLGKRSINWIFSFLRYTFCLLCSPIMSVFTHFKRIHKRVCMLQLSRFSYVAGNLWILLNAVF